MKNPRELQQGVMSNQEQGEGFSDLLMLMMGQIGPDKTDSGTDEEPLAGQLLSQPSEDHQEILQEAVLQANFGMFGQAAEVAEVPAAVVVEKPSAPSAVTEIFANQPMGTVPEGLMPTSGKQPNVEIGQLITSLLMPDTGVDTEATEVASSMVKNESLANGSLPQGITQPIQTEPTQEELAGSSIKNLPYQQFILQQTGHNPPGAQKQVLQQATLYQPNLTVVRDQLMTDNQSLEQISAVSPVMQPEELGQQTMGVPGVTKSENTLAVPQSTGLSALQSVQVANPEPVISKTNQPTQTIPPVDQQPEEMLTNASTDQLIISKSGLEPQGNKDGMQQDRTFQNNQEAMFQQSAKSADQPAPPNIKEMPVTQLPGKMAEIVRAMMVQQNAGQTTVKMKLQPEQLGEVTVKLTWSKGELSAQFITSSGLAREALESSFPQLKELLAQQNIRLSEAAVFMGQQSGQWEQQSFRDGQQWQGMKQSKGKAQFTGISSVAEPLVNQPENHNGDVGVNLVV